MNLQEWITFGAIAIATVQILKSSWFKRVRLAFTLPGPVAWPLVGNAYLAARSDEIINIANNARRYGRLLRFWITFSPVFIVTEPDDLHTVLRSNRNNDKIRFYKFMRNFLGEGLLTTNGELWKLHRKHLQTIFHPKILDEYVNVFAERTNCLVAQLSAGKCLEITSSINKLIFIILNEIILGIPAENNDESPFEELALLFNRTVKHPWLLLDYFIKKSLGVTKETYNTKTYMRNLIRRKRNEKVHFKSLLHRMLEVNDFNDEDIIKEISTLMLVGQQSTTSAISFCLYYLARDQVVQDHAYEEQKTIFSNSDRNPSTEDLSKMKYLDRCIKETLRLCPSVPFIARKIGEDLLIGDKVIPSGSDVVISPYITHRLPHVHADPHRFDPDRFTKAMDPCAYLPFSAGPRQCISYRFATLEMKTILSVVLREFRLSVGDGYEMDLTLRVTLRPKRDIRLNFERRVRIP